jgi:hypothetical protein
MANTSGWVVAATLRPLSRGCKIVVASEPAHGTGGAHCGMLACQIGAGRFKPVSDGYSNPEVKQAIERLYRHLR